EGVVVCVVQDGESRVLEVTHIPWRVTERETRPAGRPHRPAFAGRRRREGAFEIAEDDLRAPAQLPPDRAEIPLWVRGQIGGVPEHRVTYRRDGHRRQAGKGRVAGTRGGARRMGRGGLGGPPGAL